MKNTPSFRLNRLRSAMLLRGVPMLITCLAGAGQTHVAQAQQDNIDEIVVTGSRIEGVAPVGATVTVLDREAIENSGTVTLDRMIRELP
jgi:iron complex outermembrane receptor protein